MSDFDQVIFQKLDNESEYDTVYNWLWLGAKKSFSACEFTIRSNVDQNQYGRIKTNRVNFTYGAIGKSST